MKVIMNKSLSLFQTSGVSKCIKFYLDFHVISVKPKMHSLETISTRNIIYLAKFDTALPYAVYQPHYTRLTTSSLKHIFLLASVCHIPLVFLLLQWSLMAIHPLSASKYSTPRH